MHEYILSASLIYLSKVLGCLTTINLTLMDVYISCSLLVSSSADALGATLATHLDKPRVYIGCMKSGEVFSEP